MRLIRKHLIAVVLFAAIGLALAAAPAAEMLVGLRLVAVHANQAPAVDTL